MHTRCIPGIRGSQKRASDFPEPALQTFVSSRMGTGNQTYFLEEQAVLLTHEILIIRLSSLRIGHFISSTEAGELHHWRGLIYKHKSLLEMYKEIHGAM